MRVFADIEQGSPEWKEIRAGKPTASRFADIITAAKGELSKSSTAYIQELIGECFCPDFEYWKGNKFTDRGKLFEPDALDAFAALTGHDIEQVGFVLANDGVCGCSPDALIKCDGEYISGVELKCPSPKVHVGWVLDGLLPADHKQQVHGSMAVTGFNEWHFYSYFPGMKGLHVVTKRDDYTKRLEESLAAFVEQYKAVMKAARPKLQLI